MALHRITEEEKRNRTVSTFGTLHRTSKKDEDEKEQYVAGTVNQYDNSPSATAGKSLGHNAGRGVPVTTQQPISHGGGGKSLLTENEVSGYLSQVNSDLDRYTTALNNLQNVYDRTGMDENKMTLMDRKMVTDYNLARANIGNQYGSAENALSRQADLRAQNIKNQPLAYRAYEGLMGKAFGTAEEYLSSMGAGALDIAERATASRDNMLYGDMYSDALTLLNAYRNNPDRVADFESNLRRTAGKIGGDEYTEKILQRIRETAGTNGQLDLSDIEYDTGYYTRQLDQWLKPAYDTLFSIQDRAQENLKHGQEYSILPDVLGRTGELINKATSSAAQSQLDASAAAAMGLSGGAAYLPFALRAYGGQALEARRYMLDAGIQIGKEEFDKIGLASATSAGIEVLTEALSGMVGAMSKVTGGGAIDDFVSTKLQDAVKKIAKTEAGQELLGKLVKGAVGGAAEGLEEVVGNVLNYVLDTAGIYGAEREALTVGTNIEDFLIGGISAFLSEGSANAINTLRNGYAGKQIRSGKYTDYQGNPIDVKTLMEAAAAADEGSDLNNAYADLLAKMQMNKDAGFENAAGRSVELSNEDIGRLYTAYAEQQNKTLSASYHIADAMQSIRDGKELTRAQINRISQDELALHMLNENGAMDEMMLTEDSIRKGKLSDRRFNLEAALEALARSNTGSESIRSSIFTSPQLGTNMRQSEPINTVPGTMLQNYGGIQEALNAPSSRPITQSTIFDASTPLGGRTVQQRLDRNIGRAMDENFDTVRSILRKTNIGMDGKMTILANYDGVTDPGDYIEEADKIYENSRAGGDIDLNNTGNIISAETARDIHLAGRADYLTERKQEEIRNDRAEAAGLRVREGGERNDSESAGRPLETVAEGTRSNQVGQAGFVSGQGGIQRVRRETLTRQSLAQIGLKDETDSSREDIRAARAYVEGKGMNFVAWSGGAMYFDDERFGVRGYYDGETNTVYVRTDHKMISVGAIARHEATHGDIANGKIRLGSARGTTTVDFGTVRDALVKAMGGVDKFNELLDSYVEMYAGSGLSDDAVFEELVCDAMGGMNEALYRGYGEEARRLAPGMQMAKETAEGLYNANGVRAGPVEGGKASMDTESIPTITISTNNELAKLLEGKTGKDRYDTLFNYLKANYSGQTFNMSDGLVATMDNSDAKEMKYKSGTNRIAVMSDLKNVVESAVYYDKNDHPVHPKYSAFRYYAVDVEIGEGTDPLRINVGLARNDKKWHIYDFNTRTEKASPENPSAVGVSGSGDRAHSTQNGAKALSEATLANAKVNVKKNVPAGSFLPQTEADAKSRYTGNDASYGIDQNGKKFSLDSMAADIVENKFQKDLVNKLGWSKSQVGELVAALNELMEYIKPNRDILDLNEEYKKDTRPYSPYKPNSDPLYKISLDYSTLCRKRLMTQYIIEKLQLREHRPMSGEEQIAIRDMLKEYRQIEQGLQVACAMCYVEAARLKSPDQMNRYFEDPEPVLKNYFAQKNKAYKRKVENLQKQWKIDHGYSADATKSAMSPADVAAFNEYSSNLRKNYDPTKDQSDKTRRKEELDAIERAKNLSPDNYLSAENLANLKENDELVYAAYTSHIRAATRSKGLETDVPYYYGDSRRKGGPSDKFIQNVNAENGMRFSSWSDFQFTHLLDQMMAIIDLSVRKAAMHGYTKFPEQVRIFGKTGAMFNMSGVSGGTGFNPDGSLYFSPTESINFEEAKKLRDEFPDTAGLQCIGINEAHTRALLRSDFIDYVIPYHVSGLNATLRKMAGIANWKDYTAVQEERVIDPDEKRTTYKWHKAPVFSEFFDKNWYNDPKYKGNGVQAMRDAADRYVKMCAERGLRPKFEEYLNEDNYWKLLIDRKMVNQITGDLIQQRPVTPDFDFSAIRKEIDAYVADTRKAQGIEDRALQYITDHWDELPGRIEQLKKEGAVEKTIAKSEAGEKMMREIEHKANVLGSGMIAAHGKSVARYSRDVDKGKLDSDAVQDFVARYNEDVLYNNDYIRRFGELTDTETGVEERGVIRHGIKNGYAVIDDDARYGHIDSARYRYYFDVYGDTIKLENRVDLRKVSRKDKIIEEENNDSSGRANIQEAHKTFDTGIRNKKYTVYNFGDAEESGGRGKANGVDGQQSSRDTKRNTRSRSGNQRRGEERKFSRDVDSPLAPTFYSKLEREVEAFKGDKIGASSAIQYLKGKGVKDEEIKWSGIATFLEGKKSVTKEDLLEFLRENRLEITEEILDDSDTEIYVGPGGEVNVSHYFTDEDVEIESVEEFETIAKQIAMDEGYDAEDVEISEEYGTLQAISKETGELFLEASHPDPYELADAEMKPATAVRWDDYRMRGGNNYREILYRLPKSEYENTAMETHWGRRGVLAHARVQDFWTPDGEKILFVDEIQSDWHNEGAKSGYKGDKITDEKLAEIKAERANATKAYEDALGNAADIMNEYILRPSGYEYSGRGAVEKAEDVVKYASYHHDPKAKIAEALEYEYGRWGINDGAIEKTTNALFSVYEKSLERMAVYSRTRYAERIRPADDAPFRNNYTDFVLKNLLRKAAEGGYGYLAWTTGKMQEDRWSSDYAEGYRIEYDQQIPSFLKKYGKQWGAKLTEVTLSGNGETAPAIDITDAMMDSVLHEGQARFSRDLPENADETAKKVVENLRRKASLQDLSAKYGNYKSAAYTDARIEREIQMSYATGSRSKDYAQDYIAFIRPEDFIMATSTGSGREMLYEQVENKARREGRDSMLDLNQLSKEKQSMFLNIEADENGRARIVGHEGRHRMIGLEKEGYKYVPVIIHPREGAYPDGQSRYTTKPIDMLWLYGQEFGTGRGESFVVHDILPLSANYADIAREIFAGGKNVTHFSRDVVNDDLYNANRELKKDLTEMRRLLQTRTQQRDYWRGQTKVTVGRQLRQDDANRLAGELIRSGDSTADRTGIGKKLKALGEYMINSSDDINAVEENARMQAYEIAHDILNEAKELKATGGEDFYLDLKGFLKQNKIFVSPSVRTELAKDGWNEFRKEMLNRGITVTADDKKGATVDKVYQDLKAQTGEWLLPDLGNEADQLNKLIEVMETYRPVYEPINSNDMADAVEWMANEIMTRVIGENIRETNPTYADRMTKKIADMKVKHQTALKKVRTQRDQAIDNLKKHYRDLAEDKRIKRAASEERTKLLNIARRLNNKKLNRVTRELLNKYIGDLDLVSKGITGQTVHDLVGLKDWYDAYKDHMGENFVPDHAIEERLQRLSKRHISEMTQEEVADLTLVLQNIETLVRTENEMIESRIKADTYAAGQQVIQDIKASNARKSILDKYIATETATPEREIRKLTGYNDDDPLYVAAQELSDGQRKMLDYQRRAEALFKHWTDNKKFTDAIAGKKAELITVQGLVDGELKDVEITPAMRMSLYLHEKNDDNVMHITKGGVSIPDMKLYKQGKVNEAYENASLVVFTRGMLKRLANGMSLEEKAFADAVYRYYNGMSRDAINEVSELLKGYSLAGVENYYPIDTDGAFLSKEFDTIRRDGSIEGMGMLKERIKGASVPIMLYDMTDTLRKSISQHSKYYGLAIPVRNFQRLYNVNTFKDRKVDYKFDPHDRTDWRFDTSVIKALEQEWGSSATKYIAKMIADVSNGTGLDRDVWGSLFANYRSKYAGAVLTTNASVAMKQAASYPTAASVVGWEPLAKALTDRKPVDLDELAKYTPLLWYRSKGFSTAELGDIGKAGGHIPKALNWIQAMDIATTKKLVKAAMYYVGDNSNLAKGTDEWYKEVARIYNRIIEETQPNYTIMQRPQILRSDNDLTRALNMFKTQPYQNFNILYDAFGNLSAKTRQYKAEGTEDALARLQEARKTAARAVGSQVASAFVFALMQFAWDMFRGKGKKYRDDDDEMTLLSWLKGMGINVLSSAGGMVPFGGYVLELGETMTDAISKAFGGEAIFDQKFYGLSENATEAFNDMGSALISLVMKAAQALKGGEVKESTIRSLIDSMTDIAQFAGIPLSNVVKTAQAIARNTFLATDGQYIGGFKALRVTTDPSKYSSDYYDLLYKAYVNDKKAYEDLKKRMLDLDAFTEEKISNALRKRQKEKLDQDAAYQQQYKELTGSSLWQKATSDQREAALDNLTQLALQEAGLGNTIGESLQNKIVGGKNVGLDSTEYILYKLALQMVDQPKGEKGHGSPTNDEYEKAIQSLSGLSKAERAYLWSTTHDSDKNNPWK